jgi:hypothetical protein
MADRQISDLTAATQILPQDLFVLEQTGVAKKLTGQILENWLVSYADGHGGIQSIELTSESGLAKTYTITFADETTFDYVVNDGRGITGFRISSRTGTPGDGQSYVGTFSYNDGTQSSIGWKDGYKGDPGDSWYVWIRYASVMPDSDDDMTTVPSDYIGIYSGTSSTAPDTYLAYNWYRIKGDKGDTGDPAEIVSTSVEYSVGASGIEAPQDGWSAIVPTVPQGSYLWTRAVVQFNSGGPVTLQFATRYGLDGTGSVVSVNNVSPESNGNVELTSDDITFADGSIADELLYLRQMYYKSGNTVVETYTPAYGYVSNGGKQADIAIALPKMFPPNVSVTITSLYLYMRKTSGGYLGAATYSEAGQNQCVGYVQSTKAIGTTLKVDLSNPNGWGETNNVPTAGAVSVTFTVSENA